MSTHNLSFEQKYEKISEFLSENSRFLVVKFSIYLNRRVFIMSRKTCCGHSLAVLYQGTSNEYLIFTLYLVVKSVHI